MHYFSEFRRYWIAGSENESRLALLGSVALLVAGIAVTDWKIQPNVSLGFFYTFPILIAAGHLERWETVFLAAACAGLRETFAPFSWDADTVPRMAMVLTAFVGTGLFVSELKRNRGLVLRRLEAEGSLRALVDTSPAAILTLDAEAKVSLANEAAHRLLGFEEQSLRGQAITPYLPALASAMQPERGPSPMRTMIEERGQRRNGDAILTHIWFSTYDTSAGRGLAAIVLDVSEDFRDREHGSLQSVMWTSRVVLGALNHEVRNVCEALAAVRANAVLGGVEMAAGAAGVGGSSARRRAGRRHPGALSGAVAPGVVVVVSCPEAALGGRQQAVDAVVGVALRTAERICRRLNGLRQQVAVVGGSAVTER
jgi:PAS domain S-box-containing protein